MSRLPLAALAAGPRGFAGDPRFAARAPSGARTESAVPAVPLPDPLAEAYARGHADGRAEAEAEAADAIAARDAAQHAISIACARLDGEQRELLAQRLHETVLALCEGVLAGFAIDPEALAKRVTQAAQMLSRADDDRVIRLHPDDLELVVPRLPADWTFSPDPALPRGGLRIETAAGGVEDGPDTWRRALEEALGAC